MDRMNRMGDRAVRTRSRECWKDRIQEKRKNALTLVLPLGLIFLSMLFLNTDWIYSTVLFPYTGIFQDASEITEGISDAVDEYADIDLDSASYVLRNLEDGALGPVELSETVVNLKNTVAALRGYSDEFDKNIVQIGRVRNLLMLFTMCQSMVYVVIVAGLLQAVLLVLKNERVYAPLLFLAQTMMILLFGFAVILCSLFFQDLKLTLTPFPVLALLAAIPVDGWKKFLICAKDCSHRLRSLIQTERGRRIRIAMSAAAVGLTIVIASVAAYVYYAYLYRKENEKTSDEFVTSTDAVFSDNEFRMTLRKYGFTKESNLDRIVKDSYVIPGLRTTRTLSQGKELAVCTSMTPQGVCIAGPYLLISAYCASREHNSVIYVINRKTHSFVKEIVLHRKPHVGGITYDAKHENVWLCDYENESNTAYVCAFSMKELKKYNLTSSRRPIDYLYKNPIYSLKRTSFLDYYSEKLYIGHYESKLSGYTSIQSFFLNQEDGEISSVEPAHGEGTGLYADELIPSTIAVIPGGVQGFTTGASFSAISISKSNADSRLLAFRNRHDENMLQFTEDPDGRFTLPPMLEEISVYKNKIYLCFESGAYAYRARLNPKVDRIVVLDLVRDSS